MRKRGNETPARAASEQVDGVSLAPLLRPPDRVRAPQPAPFGARWRSYPQPARSPL